jgi:hypothetical protein
MALDEHTRHALHLRLDELLGTDLAAAMMTAYDQPIPWQEVATKKDLEVLEHRLMSAMHSQTKTMIFGTVGLLAAATGVVATLAQLFE